MAILQPTPSPGPEALGAIYREHVQFVLRSLRRLGVPEASVEDLCQDVFVVAARRLADFEGRSSVRTWLFGIGMRVARARRRSASRHHRKLHALRSETPLHARTRSLPQERGDAQRILSRLLSRLDDEKRAVYVLVELEGMSAVEVAEGFGVNVNTIYTRLRAARKRLRAEAEAWQRAEGER